jgi:hypothetical protein
MICFKEFFIDLASILNYIIICLTGYLPAGRQGISDFGSDGWGFPACRQTGNPFAVTNKTKYHIKSSRILEVIYVVFFFKAEL